MKWRWAALAFVAGLGLGGVLGYELSRVGGDADATTDALPLQREASQRIGPQPAPASAIDVADRSAAKLAAPAPDSSTKVAAGPCAERVAELELASQDCLRKLRSCPQPDPAEGEPIPFPPGISGQFKQDQLVASLDAAFKESGLEGEVLVADCDEYPCLACASLGAPAEHVDVTALHKAAARLTGTAALARFREAAKVGGTFSAKLPGSKLERLVMCQGYYPKPDDAAEEESIRKRAQERIIKLRNAF